MDIYSERAALLKVMAHPTRLQILDLLRCEDECVCHLVVALNRPQAYVSQQLAVLRNAGLVQDHKAGNRVYYGLADGQVGQGIRAVLDPVAENLDGDRRLAHEKVGGCSCPKCSC